ncbi:MAG: ComEC/Rec2 family competence protein [Bacteroidota bacterium]
MFWNRFPLARILIPFIIGISLALGFHLSYILPISLFLVLISLIVFFGIVLQRKLSYGFRWLAGVPFILFFLFAGYQLTVLSLNVNNPGYFGKHLSQKKFIIATLSEPLQIKEKVCKAIVQVSFVTDSVQWHKTSGKAVVYFEKDSVSQNLKYGDRVILYSIVTEVKPPLNPGEFNYKNYLKNRSIEYQTYVKKNHWRFLDSGNGNPIVAFTYKIRDNLLAILQKAGISGNEYAVVSALLIGYTDKLDPDLIKDYQGSGAMHILSVSGMHVGIVFVVLNYLLFFFDKTKYGRIPKAIILLTFIWFYAMLTGLSPAVVRTAGMFSFIVVGNAYKRPPNIYNTLVSSAFVLLAINPFYLTDVGFQLSYLAVIGIVAIYPYIYKSLYIKYWLIDKIWSLVAVSIAAQLVTFPLSMYYFHQFPNYFILTNIIAVPCSAVVIYLGIAVLVFWFVPGLSVLVSKALTLSLKFLNGSIAIIENLPYSVSRAISISALEMICIYALIILLLVYIIKKNKKALLASLTIALVMFISISASTLQSKKQKKIIVYNINKHTAIDFVYGNNCFFVCDSALQCDIQKQEYHIFNNRYNLKTKLAKSYQPNQRSCDNNIYLNSGIIEFCQTKLVVVSKTTYNTKKLQVDYVLISQNPNVSIAQICQQFQARLFIFDASNSAKNIAKWKKQCEKMQIKHYSTPTSGAWIYSISESA